MPDVFISYGRADRPHAEKIASVLEEHGWSVWWDRKLLAGETFAHTIEKALDEARCVIVLWSASSVTSSWVKDEATDGTKRNILVPVLIDEVEVPLGFRQLHTVALIDPARAEDSTTFDDLVAAVESVLRRAPSPSAVAGQPIEPGPALLPRAPSRAPSMESVPRTYRYVATGVAAILALLVLWGQFGSGSGPINGASAGRADAPAERPAPDASGSLAEEPPRTSAAGIGASLPSPKAVSSAAAEVTDSPSDATSIFVSGKGQDFYTVFDAGSTKQLGYARTDQPIELFAGEYDVALHGVRRSVRLAPGRRTTLSAGTVSVSGTGNDFFEVHDSTGKTQLGYAKTNGMLELFPGSYLLVLHGVSVVTAVRAGHDTIVPAGRVVVPGSGKTFYTVYDAKGEKQLSYAYTNVEIELLPGDYSVELNNVRRTAQVIAGQRTVVDR